MNVYTGGCPCNQFKCLSEQSTKKKENGKFLLIEPRSEPSLYLFEIGKSSLIKQKRFEEMETFGSCSINIRNNFFIFGGFGEKYSRKWFKLSKKCDLDNPNIIYMGDMAFSFANGICATVDDKRAILCSPSQNEQTCWDFHVKNYFQKDESGQTNLPHSNGGVVSYQNDVIIVAGNGPSSSNLATEMNKGSEWVTQTDIMQLSTVINSGMGSIASNLKLIYSPPQLESIQVSV